MDEIPGAVDTGFDRDSTEIVRRWPIEQAGSIELVTSVFNEVAAEHSRRIYEPLENLKRHLAEVLDGAAKALNVDDTLGEEKLDHVLKEMPRLDFGTIDLNLRQKFLLSLGREIAKRRVETALRRQTETVFSNARSVLRKAVGILDCESD